MNKENRLSETELNQMFQLIKRYTNTEMDQWDLWKFDAEYGKVYVSFTREVPKSEEGVYVDINHAFK